MASNIFCCLTVHITTFHPQGFSQKIKRKAWKSPLTMICCLGFPFFNTPPTLHPSGSSLIKLSCTIRSEGLSHMVSSSPKPITNPSSSSSLNIPHWTSKGSILHQLLVRNPLRSSTSWVFPPLRHTDFRSPLRWVLRACQSRPAAGGVVKPIGAICGWKNPRIVIARNANKYWELASCGWSCLVVQGHLESFLLHLYQVINYAFKCLATPNPKSNSSSSNKVSHWSTCFSKGWGLMMSTSQD